MSARSFFQRPLALFIALFAAVAAQPALAATITVDSGADTPGDCTGAVPGTCTLRAAIGEANGNGDTSNTIEFSVGTVTLLSNLPAITKPLVINGGGASVDGNGSSVLRYSGAVGGTYSVSDLELTGGSAAADGGCFHFGVSGASAVTLSNVTVSLCTTTAGGDGGGVAVEMVSGSSLTLSSVSLLENIAAGDGGGLWVRLVGSGTMTLQDSLVNNNDAVNGGGIEVARGRLTILRSTISNNGASGNGGGLHLDVDGASGGSAAIENTTFVFNTANANGGGISAATGNTQPSRMIHTTIAQNTGTTGGGIGTVAAQNVIFPGTSANPFTSNIVAENISTNCGAAFTHNSADSGYNRSNDTSCGFNQPTDSQTFDPAWLADTLADNLGTTTTLRLAAGTIALPNTAIDAANPAYANAADQRAAPAADGNADTTVARDIGAYEFAGFGAMQFTAAAFTVREDGTPAAIGVQRFGNTAPATDIEFTTTDGTATGVASCPGSAAANADFQTQTAAAVTFAAGQSTPSPAVTVTICGDPGVETDETVNLALATPAQGSDVGARASATLTIQEINEGTLAFKQATFDASEAAGTVNMVIEVTRTGGSSDAVGVSYSVTGGTASGSDYTDATPTPGSLSWADGDATSKFIVLTLNNDTACELGETVDFEITNATNGSTLGAQDTATFTITDNDGTGAGTVQFDAASYTAAEDGGNKTITVKRVGGCVGAISVDVNDIAGTATEPGDYSFLAAQTLNWTSGDSADKTVSVTIIDDATRESNHQFQMDLLNPVGTTISGTDPVAVTITPEAGEAVQFNFTATSYSVGEAGPSVTLDVENVQAVEGGDVSIAFNSADGTATAGSDYTAVSNSLSWTGGSAAGTAQTITVPITSDALVEGNETFQVTLSAPVGGGELTGTNPVTVTIVDPTALSFTAASFASANETGGSSLTITVQRTGSGSGAVSVTYNVDDSCTAPGCATLGDDFNSSLSGTLNWGNNDTANKTFTITVLGDALLEGNETIALSLTAPSGAILGTQSTATAVVTDDEYRFEFAAASPFAEDVGTASIAVQRTGSTIGTASVSFATADDTALAGSDYTATASPPTLSWAAGEGGTKTIAVPVTDDALDEVDETFTVSLSSPSNNGNGEAQSVGAGLTATITDNDAPPQLVIDDLVGIAEGDMLASTATFTVSLTDGLGNAAPSGKTVMVTATTGGGTATADSDYDSNTQILSIAAGDTSATFDVSVNGDTLDEDDETFDVTLSLASNATVLDDTGTGTIVNDDTPPTVSVGNVSVTEGNAGTVDLVFAITLSAVSGRDVTVDYVIAAGTATSGTDYVASPVSGNALIPAGSLSVNVTVVVNGDTLDEANETLTWTLSNPVNATLGTATGTGTILDNDAAPSLSIADVTVTEGNTTDVTMTFTVTLSAASGQTVTVNYATADGTALAPADYTAVPTTGLTFTPGQTSKTVSVTIKSDAIDEVAETLMVNLSTPANATIADGAATGTITDAADDVPPPTDDGGSWSLLSLWLLLPAWLRRRKNLVAA